VKIILIGAGGVGAWFADELARQIENEQFEFDETIDIADPDIIELDQLRYQNFERSEIGENKANALAKRLNEMFLNLDVDTDVFRAIPKRIEKERQLKGYDFFVLCVDNEATRDLVIRYCHRNGKEFIDLRATGRKIFAMPKLRTLEENLKFVDGADKEEYSCQNEKDLEKGRVQLGNKVVALIGVQMLMNFQRGHGNRIISTVV